jgi:hypothetical protein
MLGEQNIIKNNANTRSPCITESSRFRLRLYVEGGRLVCARADLIAADLRMPEKLLLEYIFYIGLDVHKRMIHS